LFNNYFNETDQIGH